MLSKFRDKIRAEIAADPEQRRFGMGWISGVIALIGSLAALAVVVCILFPDFFTVPELRTYYANIPYRLALFALIFVSYIFAVLSLVLRSSAVMGLSAIVILIAATILGHFDAHFLPEGVSPQYFGLDWFVLNLILTGVLFVPLERLFPQRAEQGLFRDEWKEDLFYYFISSMMVQILTMISLWPSEQIVAYTSWEHFKQVVAAQPFVVQFLEVMFLTDLVQYWVHRTFHRIPFLWKFHAVHHSAKSLDWMAGARMHFIEIIILRGFTVIPMSILGFSLGVIQFYILVVYLYSTFIHANVRWSPQVLDSLLVTPRFHHWHHGIEREAIDVNFSIHFPLFDRLFGTFHMPKNRWPEGYGIKGHPVPQGYVGQFLYPFKRKKRKKKQS